MVIVAGDVASEAHHLLERMILARVGLGAKTIPGRHTVILDLPLSNALLEKLKCSAQTLRKLFRRNRRQLRLGIVHVVDVHTINSQVSSVSPEEFSKRLRAAFEF